MRRLIRWGLAALLFAAGALAGLLWLAFGGGDYYPDLTTEPVIGPDGLEIALNSDRPIGNAAVGPDGRIYYTIHPESHPEGPVLYRWADGAAAPWPDAARQADLFQSPLGLVVDGQRRLWVIDPGHHGLRQPRLLAFDTLTGEVVHRFDFPSDIAPWGSFLQDLQVGPDGRWIYIADVGFWAKRPALVVYDSETRQARRVLNRHPSVYPQDIVIRTPIRDMRYFGGLLAMKTGVDGIALSRDGAWLYYGAMTHDTLYRVPADVLRGGTDEEIAAAVEPVGAKPLNDGLSTDEAGNVLITDVEHGAVLSMTPGGRLVTLVRDPRIRWADGLSFGPVGWVYLADSAIPHLVLRGAAHHAAAAPYHIWRFRPGTAGVPGQ